MPAVVDLLVEAKATVSQLPTSREQLAPLDDDQLMQVQRLLADVDRMVRASSAATAGEVAWRSRPELGYAGLAQRTGARTAESLVQQLTGSTGREAATLVRVGNVMAEAELLPSGPEAGVGPDHDADPGGSPATEPAVEGPWDGTGTAWLAPVGRAVSDGSLPVAAADAIRSGLGVPSETVTVSQLTLAARSLVTEAAVLHADQLFKRARAVRDEIDAAGVAERERRRHELRYLRVFKRRDGMVRVDGLLAPESGGAEVLAAAEAITAPRRGGPRFVDAAEQQRAKRILDDPRTSEQLQADGFVELIRLGVTADPGSIVGTRKPAVRVLVTSDDVQQPDGDQTGTQNRGIGWLEGHSDAVSIGTVRRTICETGIIPIRFDDDGQCLNVGREQRLYTAVQRIALATRDGGCRFPGCDRPPSWCEAHHLHQWARDGRTDLADGILLCRHHHMLIHNNHWRIKRDGANYLLIPPRERDPDQTPIPMPSKSHALADLQRRRRAG
ncbi:DUF222 domain-containing protein [Lysobacter korlensis]|uniref:DUF222 domain-containing protein n=1 Tax=Lysobacter korlensis TaxID=553636 RepID=A0ABV6RTE5_9GAMM